MDAVRFLDTWRLTLYGIAAVALFCAVVPVNTSQTIVSTLLTRYVDIKVIPISAVDAFFFVLYWIFYCDFGVESVVVCAIVWLVWG